MARFSREEMLDELRTIFLFEADHVYLASGPEKAKAFIGFEPEGDNEYCYQSPSRVDLNLFRQITVSFEEGYEFAFQPSVNCLLGEHEVQDLIAFMEGTPKIGGASSAGEKHRFMTPDGYCQTVADTVMARWMLEWDTAFAGSHEFTTRQLALLANMTEGAVRNALSDKSENGLRATPGSKPVTVSHDEAWRWLSGRRGFIPWPKTPAEDRFLTENLRSVTSAAAFGSLINDRLWRETRPTVEALLNWTKPEIEGWATGHFVFDPVRAEHLARALGFDVPLFVGKALEVSMRRDANVGEGEQP